MWLFSFFNISPYVFKLYCCCSCCCSRCRRRHQRCCCCCCWWCCCLVRLFDSFAYLYVHEWRILWSNVVVTSYFAFFHVLLFLFFRLASESYFHYKHIKCVCMFLNIEKHVIEHGWEREKSSIHHKSNIRSLILFEMVQCNVDAQRTESHNHLIFDQ